MALCVIPDLHADVDRMARSLGAVSERDSIAFLGDFIDAKGGAGAANEAAVLEGARGLVDVGRAVAVMGNHELNALLFHREGVDGVPLRARSDKNLAQHRSFCAAFGVGTAKALDWTRWFLTLPLWLDTGGLRLVHACWDAGAIATVAARRADGRLCEEDLAEVAAGQSAFARAVSLLLTGPEMLLPDGLRVADSSGHMRDAVRLAWWRGSARNWREAVVSLPDPDALPDAPLGADAVARLGAPDGAPVLCGHYQLAGAAVLEDGGASCIDFPEAPCVYRWDGETCLNADNLLAV